MNYQLPLIQLIQQVDILPPLIVPLPADIELQLPYIAPLPKAQMDVETLMWQ